MDKSLSLLLSQGDTTRANNSAHRANIDADSARSRARSANSLANELERNRDEWMAHAQTLEQKLVEVTDRSAERKIVNESLKGVIRYALNELRKENPNNPMLNKKERDRVFEMFAIEEQIKMEKKRKENGYKPVNITFTEPDSHQSP